MKKSFTTVEYDLFHFYSNSYSSTAFDLLIIDSSYIMVILKQIDIDYFFFSESMILILR